MKNQIKFTWIPFDSWFSSIENIELIKLKHNKEVVGALKSDRLVALTEEDCKSKRFTRIDHIEQSEQESVTGQLKGMKFPVRLVRQVFTNKDGSSGILYLARSQLTADWKTITTIYKKRWNVEVYRKLLKSKLCLRAVRSAFDELQKIKAA